MSTKDTNGLSEREMEILRLVATGASNKEIAQSLYISSNTVKVHLRNIFNKIGVTSRTEAAMYAVRIGLVQPDGSIDDDSEENDTIPQEDSSTSQRRSFYLRMGISALLLVIIVGIIGISIQYVRGSQVQVATADLPMATNIPRWEELGSLPTPRSGIAVASFENQIYVIGGESEQGVIGLVERYDPDTNSWIELSSKPIPVSDINAEVIGSEIFIPGGSLESDVPTYILEIYNPRIGGWGLGSPLPTPLSAYASVTYEGRLFVFGGWNGDKYSNAVYVYDPQADTWEESTPMPTARGYAAATVVGNKIYILGGLNEDGIQKANEIYQPDLDNGVDNPWIAGKPLPIERFGMGIANIADVVYLIGGKGPESNLKVLAYIPQQDEEWGQIEAPLQANWVSLGATTIGTRLYAMGGEVEEGLVDDNWSFQPIFTITLPIVR
jgi:DNA-binding CsgD family transcriptional regulator